MVLVSMLPQAEIGRNDHQEGAPHFINCKFLKIGVHHIIHILAYYPCFGKQIEQSNSRVQ